MCWSWFFCYLRKRTTRKEGAEPGGVTHNSTLSCPNCYPYTVLTSGLLFPYDTWLNLARSSFHLHSRQRTYKWYLCLFPATRRRNLSDVHVVNNFNYERSVLCLSKRETNVCGKFNVFGRQARNMSKNHIVLLQLSKTMCFLYIHTYKIIYGYRILCLLTQ